LGALVAIDASSGKRIYAFHQSLFSLSDYHPVADPTGECVTFVMQEAAVRLTGRFAD
jgi:hypothetical protein